ncbi:hypothetical protein [Acetohalobium arabaticum]|uniref:Asparagine synthase n=1 Tax=Acetohalobium arabaticum (strain ATCC 49924 / DSM 5501 / Z-7288) TaxID=574087 RepID=D9QUD1_ACEAZ|nr:conserved hypothetical protein [Acetohalobium arabaticum DSM 5501]
MIQQIKRTKEGAIPTALGTVVTGLGIGMRSVNPALGWGIAGFGLAHVLLGAIDLVEHQ